MPYTNSNVENVQLGTCSVKFGLIDLGLTKGGVEVQVRTQTTRIRVDHFTYDEEQEYITNRTVTVKVPLAETDLSLLNTVIPASVLTIDGVDSDKEKVEVFYSAGVNIRDFAEKLVLHPIALPDEDKNFDFVVPLAAPKGEFTFQYSLNEERIYSVEFTAFPETGTEILYVVGDESIESGPLLVESSLLGNGTLNASILNFLATQSTLAGTGALTASIKNLLKANSTLNGTGALTASIKNRLLAASSLAGTGTINASIVSRLLAASSLTGTGTITANAVIPSSGIAFVGSRSSFTSGATSGTLAVSLATLADENNNVVSPQIDDLIVINYGTGSTADRSFATPTDTAGNTYSEWVQQYSDGSTSDTNHVIWAAFVDSVPTSISVPNSGSNSDALTCEVFVFRGVNRTTPLDVTITTATGTGTGRPDAPSITPSTAGAWIMTCMASAAAAATAYTIPSDLSATTNHWRSTTSADTNDSMSGAGLKTDWSSGAFDPAAITAGGTTGAGDSWCAATIALKPA
jgi:hypothetical protein